MLISVLLMGIREKSSTSKKIALISGNEHLKPH